jgi:putative acetyltransferase
MDAHATRTEAIRQARSPRDIALARALFVEYAQWLQVDLCFQGFEEELATLPGVYAPPRGRLLLAGTPDSAFGCIALRPLDADSGCGGGTLGPRSEGPVAEVKRLYVESAYRRQGWGQRLAQALLGEARVIGYRELRLDTFDWMTGARALYTSLGFRDSAPYYNNPLAGAVYMVRTL